jgi:hypothetical protein
MTENEPETVNEYEEGKYIVFKLEDWKQFGGEEWMGAQPVDDAVVIRLKDSYAASALHAYTNAILTVLDIMGDDMDPEVYQQQLNIADYFHQQATASGEIKNKRLPD